MHNLKVSIDRVVNAPLPQATYDYVVRALLETVGLNCVRQRKEFYPGFIHPLQLLQTRVLFGQKRRVPYLMGVGRNPLLLLVLLKKNK